MNVDAAGRVLAAILALSGGLALLAALLNWNWFFESQNARSLTGRMSRTLARLLYGIVGCGALIAATTLI